MILLCISLIVSFASFAVTEISRFSNDVACVQLIFNEKQLSSVSSQLASYQMVKIQFTLNDNINFVLLNSKLDTGCDHRHDVDNPWLCPGHGLGTIKMKRYSNQG